MTLENLKRYKESLERALEDVNEILKGGLPYKVYTQFDEGGYTDGYEVKHTVIVDSYIDQEGDLMINFYCEGNKD